MVELIQFLWVLRLAPLQHLDPFFLGKYRAALTHVTLPPLAFDLHSRVHLRTLPRIELSRDRDDLVLRQRQLVCI